MAVRLSLILSVTEQTDKAKESYKGLVRGILGVLDDVEEVEVCGKLWAIFPESESVSMFRRKSFQRWDKLELGPYINWF